MNVLFLTYSYLPDLGGVQRSVANLARRLLDGGHRVTVAAHAESVWVCRYTRGRPAVLHLYMPSPFSSHTVSDVRRRSRDALNTAVLAWWCRMQRVDIIHCHHLNADTRYAHTLARRLHIPFLITLRGGETEEWIVDRPRRREYLATLLTAANAVTAVSCSLVVHAQSCVPEVLWKSTLIPNAVDRSLLLTTIGRHVQAPHPRPYVLFVGRLEAMKDVACLIDSYHEIIAEDPSFQADLLIAGSGTLAVALRQRAASGAGGERIIFVGAQPYADTLRLIRDALMLVLPSCSSEGCPNVILEAMALQTPVIVSDLASLTEIVADRVRGRVFPRGDCEALHQRIRDLERDAREREHYARAAAAWVQAVYTFDSVVGKYLEVYAALVAGGSERTRVEG